MNPERSFLAEAIYDAQQIDKALQAGLSQAHFADQYNRELWGFLLELRGSGLPTDEAGVFAEASARGLINKLGGPQRFIETTRLEGHISPTGTPWLSVLLDQHAKREACRRLAHAQSLLASNSASLEEIKAIAEEVAETCAGRRNECRDLNAIDAEITAEVEASKTGKKDESKLIRWGIPKLDKFLTPIESHEYVLICARPSCGKSSMLTQLAARNMHRGKRIAYFTLETSDKSVVKQMAAQMAKVDLKKMTEWMPEHYRAFDEAREFLRRSGQFMIFDRDIDLFQIEARCRLLAATFKPDAVMMDYLGLIRAPGKSIYERVSTASKAMIPLKKALGCALIVGQQLNRQAEGQDTEPSLGNLRDSGQLEEDAHRVVMLHWKNSRMLDTETWDYRILQPKLRDGPKTAVDGIKFHAPTTRFYEEA